MTKKKPKKIKEPRKEVLTDLFVEGLYIGFSDEGNRVYLEKCPKCKKENFALIVADGYCAWCGYKHIIKKGK
jgi:hypothetical protein